MYLPTSFNLPPSDSEFQLNRFPNPKRLTIAFCWRLALDFMVPIFSFSQIFAHSFLPIAY